MPAHWQFLHCTLFVLPHVEKNRVGWLLSGTLVGDGWNKVITKPASVLNEPVCSAAQLSSSRLLHLKQSV